MKRQQLTNHPITDYKQRIAPYVRRANSTVSVKSSAQQTKESEPTLSQNTEAVVNIDEKISKLHEDIKKSLEEQIMTITTMLNNSNETIQFVLTKTEIDYNQRYEELAYKYLELKNLRQAEFENFATLIARYQALMVKICILLFSHSDASKIFTNEEADLLKKLMNNLENQGDNVSPTIDGSMAGTSGIGPSTVSIQGISSIQETSTQTQNSTQPQFTRLTNPILSKRKNSRDIMRRNSTDCIDMQQSYKIDSSLAALIS